MIELGSWYEDADLAAAYPVQDKPTLSPAQLATMTVLQFTGDLTGRQAADAVRGRVDWKYLLGPGKAAAAAAAGAGEVLWPPAGRQLSRH